jgi:hypothetical protein
MVTPATIFFPLLGMQHHSHLLDSSKYSRRFPSYNFITFTASLFCVAGLFYKLQDRTVKELYEPGAVAQGVDIWKKLAEEAVMFIAELPDVLQVTVM